MNSYNRSKASPSSLRGPKNQLNQKVSQVMLITLTFVFFIFFLILSYWLQKQTYSSLPVEKVPRLCSRILSSVHVCLALSFSCLYLTGYIGLVAWRKLTCFSMGYFIFGLLEMFLPNVSSGLHETLEVLVHHIVVFLAIAFYFSKYPKLVAQGLLAEATTPFLYLGWALIQVGRSNTLLFKVLAGCTLIGFALCRVCNFTHVYVQLYRKGAPLFELVGFSPVVLINYYWFVLLLGKAKILITG